MRFSLLHINLDQSHGARVYIDSFLRLKSRFGSLAADLSCGSAIAKRVELCSRSKLHCSPMAIRKFGEVLMDPNDFKLL